MQRNIAYRRGVSTLIPKGHILHADVPGKGDIVILLGGLGHHVGVHHFTDAARGHLGMGVHHQGKGRHNDTVHYQSHILHHGKDIAAGSGGNPALHPAAAKVQDRDRHQVHQGDGNGRHQAHLCIRFNDMLGHHTGGLSYAALFLLLPVKGPDNADAVQPLPHQIVLLIAELVADFPQWLHPAANSQHQQRNDGHSHQDNERQRAVLGKGQHHPAEKQHRNGDDVAGKHIGHPGQRPHIVGGTGKQRRGADAADLFKGQGIHPAKNRRAQVGAKAGNNLGAAPGTGRHRPQREQRDQQHSAAATQDIVPIGGVDAAVQDITYDGGQQQRTDAGNGNQQHAQQHFPSVGLKIWQNSFHNFSVSLWIPLSPPILKKGAKRPGATETPGERNSTLVQADLQRELLCRYSVDSSAELVHLVVVQKVHFSSSFLSYLASKRV